MPPLPACRWWWGSTPRSIPLVVYAVMGTSRPLSVTSTSTIAILAAGALGQVAPGGDAATLMAASATLALLAGAFLLLGGLLRLGVVANLISDPVLTGFKAGIGLIIVLDQLPKLLGIHITKAGFFRDIWSIGHTPAGDIPPDPDARRGDAGPHAGPGAFRARRCRRRWSPWQSALPSRPLSGLDKAGIALVGTVQAGLPSFALPDLSLVEQLWPAALGIALMSFVETAAAGRAFIRRGDPAPDANRELVATGMANLAGSLFHIMPAGGGTSQTAVNDSAGARSQVAGLVTAAVVVATLLFLAPLFGLMPHPTLAAVVVIASIGLISPAEFRSILKIRSMEFRWALIAMVGVLLLGTLKGILVAVLVSLIALMVRGSRHPFCPGTKARHQRVPPPLAGASGGRDLPRPAAAPAGRRDILCQCPATGPADAGTASKSSTPRVLVLDLRAVPELEYTALRMLTDGEEKIRENGTNSGWWG